jgi:ABC-type glycerol-3-phosphate transport system substrate-binding protein
MKLVAETCENRAKNLEICNVNREKRMKTINQTDYGLCHRGTNGDAAYAEDFNWRQFEGTEITWAYDIHPYADAVVAYLDEFEELTGIKVNAELYPDDTYWGKLNIQLSTGSPDWDVVGTGIQPAWDVTPAGQLAGLRGLIEDPNMTSPSYDYEDFFPALRAAWTWDVAEEEIIANPDGEIWGIPHAFENMQLMYRTDILERLGVEPPSTLPELTIACEQIRSCRSQHDANGCSWCSLLVINSHCTNFHRPIIWGERLCWNW